MSRPRLSRAFTALVLFTGVALASPALRAWGSYGHEISGRAAVMALPADMPAFFTRAVDQLTYLNPEPDRWRDRAESTVDRALADAFDPDHYIDMEVVPAGALDGANRYEYLAKVTAAGKTAAEVGTSPYRMLEVFQRLRSAFRAWRAETDVERRTWIEQRIINDAGILGHYVTDGANPLHTTIHHHGWLGDNPQGYATDNAIHGRFEGRFVQARITLEDVRNRVTPAAQVFPAPRQAIWDYVRRSHAQVPVLYQIDKRAAFNEETTALENKVFVAERLGFGATMLRDLWWTAWVTSAPTPQS